MGSNGLDLFSAALVGACVGACMGAYVACFVLFFRCRAGLPRAAFFALLTSLLPSGDVAEQGTKWLTRFATVLALREEKAMAKA